MYLSFPKAYFFTKKKHLTLVRCFFWYVKESVINTSTLIYK